MPDASAKYRALRQAATLLYAPGPLGRRYDEAVACAQSALTGVELALEIGTPGASQATADGAEPRVTFPLESDGASFGILACTGTIGADDHEFLSAIADMLSEVLAVRADGAVLGSDPVAGKRIEEVSAIYEISQAFSSMSIDSLLRLITVKAAQVMDAQACSLMLKDPNKDELVIRASHGLSDTIVEETRVAYGEGIAGRVAQTGEPMMLSDLLEDPRLLDSGLAPRPDIASSICVPLKDAEGRVHGVLSIRRRPPSAMFTYDDMKLFSVFASQAALAISNSRLYASLKDRVQELSTLYEASRELGGAYSLQSASDALVSLASQMIDGVSAMLVLLDRHQGQMIRTVSGGFRDLREAVGAAMDEGVVSWMHSLREPRSLSLEIPMRRPAGAERFVSALKAAFARVSLVPLIAENSVIGMLILGYESGRWLEQRRVRLLSIVASQAAVIIKNAGRYEEQIGQKVLELTALYELSERVSTARSIGEALDSILDIVRDIVWYDESYVSTVDSERRVLVVKAARGGSARRLQGMELPLSDDSLGSWAIRERKALISPDVTVDKRFDSLSPDVRSDMVRSLMAIPLIVHEEVVGILNVCAYAPGLYTEDNVRTLSVIASQAAALYREMEALGALSSYTDNILRSIAAGVATFSTDGVVLTWNAAAERIMGSPAAEVTGKHYSELVNAMPVESEQKERLLAIGSQVAATGERYAGYQIPFHSRDGERLYRNISVSELHSHVGEKLGFVAVFEDVTTQVRMEREMQRIKELAATGQLAASIAHELRNPLSSIKGAAQYLRNEYEEHDAVREFLDIIIDEVNVLSRITTEFLDFARPTPYEFETTNVNDLLLRTFQLLDPESRQQMVDIGLDLDPELPTIVADGRQLEQAFRNIVLNALQAMPEGGAIRASTSAARDGVCIAVTDSGIGIPSDKLDQIFVPFFTTKTKGTGLGLAMVQKVLMNHEGTIEVKSVVGEGTTFEIWLPISCGRPYTIARPDDGAADFLRRE